jgi:hypothetical protein
MPTIDLNQVSSKQTSRRPFSHPLFGSSLSNLLHLLWSNGGVSWKYTPQLIAALLSATSRVPFSLLEQAVYAKRLGKLKMKPPIFIVGHWRSGTTHLSNLLSQSPVFGFVTPVATGIPHDLLVMGRWFRPWLERAVPPDRLIDRVPVRLDSPQEDEFGMANMVHTSFLHGLYFPKHLYDNFKKGVFFEDCSLREIEQWKAASIKYLKKIYLQQQCKQLLIRNPAYTTRIKLLRIMWPGAKFIHIYRNPYRVFPSMRNYFQKLLPALALQDYSKADIDKVILSTYPRMMDTIIDEIPGIPKNELIEVRFENLEEKPLQVLDTIYQSLGLSGYTQALPSFKHYLEGIKGYTKNVYSQEPAEVDLIKSHWQRYIDHYNY